MASVSSASEVDKDQKDKWKAEQRNLKRKHILEDEFCWTDENLNPINSNTTAKDKVILRYVAGFDISFIKDDDTEACAALVILSFPDLKIVAKEIENIQLEAPYLAGYLAFREIPAFQKVFPSLQRTHKKLFQPINKMIMFFDGNGILHPRGFGLACHAGVKYDITTIGCAKKLLATASLTKEDIELKFLEKIKQEGDIHDLKSTKDPFFEIGKVLRSLQMEDPIYISQGNKISLETATKILKLCIRKGKRLPEPIEQADKLSRRHVQTDLIPSAIKRKLIEKSELESKIEFIKSGSYQDQNNNIVEDGFTQVIRKKKSKSKKKFEGLDGYNELKEIIKQLKIDLEKLMR